MWSAIKAAKWYCLLTVVLFFVFLGIYFPASYAWKLAAPYSSSLPVKLFSVNGTVWSGSGVVRYDRYPINVSWSLVPSSLITFSPEVELSASLNSTTELHTRLQASSESLALKKLTGSIDIAVINPYLRSQNASGTGILKIYDLSLSFDHVNRIVQDASGRLLWQDAGATYPGPNGITSVELPDIAGRLNSDEKGASLDVMSGEDGSKLASLFAMNNGWAGVKVKKRSVDLVGQRWVGHQQPDDVIFQVREKLW